MGGNGSGQIPADAIIKLDGTVTNPDGSITKTKLFEMLEVDLDDYSDIEMTGAEAQKFMNHVRRMKTGLSAFLPRLCPGPARCPLGAKTLETAEHARCPFKNRWPISRACPLEVSLIKTRTQEYVESMDLDPGSPYQMSLVNELVELDVFEYRSNIGLSEEENSNLLYNEISMSKGGDVLENVVVHPYLQAKESFHRRRMNILEALVATPKEQYKEAAAIKKTDTNGISSQLAAARSLVERMNKIQDIRNIDDIIEDAEKLSASEIIEADWQTATVPNDD